jgi:hypothetical protein
VPRALLTFFVALGFVLGSFAIYRDAASSDLMATWLAGHFWGESRLDLIYPGDQHMYLMRPPAEWITYLQNDGFPHDIFPFIYPPIWGWAAQFLADGMAYTRLFTWASMINPALIAGMILLAARACRSPQHPALFLSIGLAWLIVTPTAHLALSNNQPQILVAFLTVLAIERVSRGGPIWGGAIMGLAAAIKLYPARYAAIWLGSGRWRALLGFVVSGGGLGVVSIAIAGWDMHREFLHQISVISGTVLMAPPNLSLDPIIGHLCCRDAFTYVDVAITDQGIPGGWFVFAKPALWSILSNLALLASLAIGIIAMKRYDNDPLIWPLIMILTSLVSPLSWIYHYLAPMAFIPALLDRFGLQTGLRMLILLILPLSTPILGIAGPLAPLFAVISLLGLAICFAIAIHKRA